VIARIVRSVDFERVLRTRSRVTSAHFAVHHVNEAPARRGGPAMPTVSSAELSTGGVSVQSMPVDDSGSSRQSKALWLGAVVPKRHARRSVTRTLLKRQIRAVVQAREAGLTGGLWVVRLRAPFDRTQFPSAGSNELRRVAHLELDSLITSAMLRVGAGA
jgi:ribonuclease P protein component